MSPKRPALMLLTASVWWPLACDAARPPAGAVDVKRSCYASPDGNAVRSSLVRMETSGGERLLGLTELASGERLVEDVTIDESGRLVEGVATLTPAGGTAVTRVVLHPALGSVTLTSPALNLEWRVPNDLPWVWAPVLTAHAKPIATPLDAQVVFHAAAGGRPVRLLDLGALAHHSVTADQMVVPDGDAATVLLASDVIDFENGSPRRLHLSALDENLDIIDARAPSGALVAALRCTALSGSLTP
jgi:hypothetical protein